MKPTKSFFDALEAAEVNKRRIEKQRADAEHFSDDVSRCPVCKRDDCPTWASDLAAIVPCVVRV